MTDRFSVWHIFRVVRAFRGSKSHHGAGPGPPPNSAAATTTMEGEPPGEPSASAGWAGALSSRNSARSFAPRKKTISRQRRKEEETRPYQARFQAEQPKHIHEFLCVISLRLCDFAWGPRGVVARGRLRERGDFPQFPIEEFEPRKERNYTKKYHHSKEVHLQKSSDITLTGNSVFIVV